MIYYEYCFPETDAEEKECDGIRLHSLVNSAACFLKIGQVDEAMEMSKQGLKIDPDNVKGLARLSVCYRLKDEYSLARECIDKAIHLDPQDRGLRAEKELLRATVRNYERNSKRMADLMVNSKEEVTKVEQEETEVRRTKRTGRAALSPV